MGRGRPRKPPAHLKLHGGYRAHRHAGSADLEAKTSGHPQCPDGLNAHGQWLWDFVVEELSAVGVTKRIDTPHLWTMCEVWGLYRVAVEIAKVDPTDKDARIAVVSYLAAFEAAAGKCGLTPSDRAKLVISHEKETDEFEKFLNKKA